MAYREFTDRSGAVWRAWDTYPRSDAAVRPLYARGWLSFESDTLGRKRLAPIPTGWEDASTAELWKFLEDAQSVAPSSPISVAASAHSETDASAAEVVEAEQESVLQRIRSMLRSLT